MPPLLCPSPLILDQRFPRSERELGIAATSLGTLQELVESDSVMLLMTQALAETAEPFCWSQEGQGRLLWEIWRLVNQWLLQPHEGLVVLDVSCVGSSTPHPVPARCLNQGQVAAWARELGRVYARHRECCGRELPCVGVACALGFAGLGTDTYDNPDDMDCFPLVGAEDFQEQLADAFTWSTRPNVHGEPVRTSDAKKNVWLLGADLRGGEGSHREAVFQGARTWPIDDNYQHVPERHLRQLVPITRLELDVIKQVLIDGEFPPRICKLH